MTLAIIITAIWTGALNALRGSGVLKIDEWPTFPMYDWRRKTFIWLYLNLSRRQLDLLVSISYWVQWSLKRLIVPAFFVIPAWLITQNVFLASLSVLPYFAKIFTGTGGDIQAVKGQPCDISNCSEFKPFDFITEWVIGHVWYRSSWTYCEWWGFVYCAIWGFVYTLPFLATNYLYSLPLLLYPFMARYLIWRQTEFLLVALCNGLYLFSL